MGRVSSGHLDVDSLRLGGHIDYLLPVQGSARTFTAGTSHFMKTITLVLCLAAVAVIGCKKPQASADAKDAVLPGRHMSEHQVIDLASTQLPQSSGYRCEFKDGVWEILEVQKNVWGVSSRTTNVDGKITIESTNATRVVLRVRDTNGKVEPIRTP